MKELRFLKDKDTYLEYAYLALTKRFSSREDFVHYFNAIKTDEMKNLFLRTASFYLFLVKRGDWIVDVPGVQDVIDQFTNTYKFVTIFSLIESLSKEKFIDFYQFLTTRKSKAKFPIVDKKTLDEYYKKYKDEFGSIKRCIAFFNALTPEKQHELVSRLEIEGGDATIEKFAKSLYDMRSKFVHEAELVLHMSEEMSIGYQGKKVIVCNLSIYDAMTFFEEGLLTHFQPAPITKIPTSDGQKIPRPIDRAQKRRGGKMEDYQWIKQPGQPCRVMAVIPSSAGDPSGVLYYVDLVQESGDRSVRLECQTGTGPDLAVEDVVVVINSTATSVLVEREHDQARWLLVIHREVFGI